MLQEGIFFNKPCIKCGEIVTIGEELSSTFIPEKKYCRVVKMCKCHFGHEEIREFQFDGTRLCLISTIYTKEEWENLEK